MSQRMQKAIVCVVIVVMSILIILLTAKKALWPLKACERNSMYRGEEGGQYLGLHVNNYAAIAVYLDAG